MARRSATAVALLLLFIAVVASLPRDATPASPATRVQLTPRCEETVGAGLVPRFCVNLPPRASGAEGVPDPAACARGLAVRLCEEAVLPVAGPAATAPPNGDLVCGEGGGTALAPRFCVAIPTVPTAPGDRLRPGVAELEGGAGGEFVAVGSTRAFLFIEASLPAATRDRLLATFRDDVADVERELGHEFVRPPAVYVFATRASFGRAIANVFGYSAAIAGLLSREHGGALLPGIDAAVISWESAGGDVRIVRHELVHAAIRELAGPSRVPPWLDEGLATLTLDVGGSDEEERARYAVRSLVDSGRLRLTTLRFSGPLTRLDYVAAQEAADILRTEVGQEAVRRILARTGSGVPFATAFEQVTGGTVDSFVNAFPDRLRARLPTPRIAPSAVAANGDVSWTAFGFTPSAEATVTVTGGSYRLVYAANADGFGMVTGTFGSTAPAGEYRLMLSEGALTVSLDLRTGR